MKTVNIQIRNDIKYLNKDNNNKIRKTPEKTRFFNEPLHAVNDPVHVNKRNAGEMNQIKHTQVRHGCILI